MDASTLFAYWLEMQCRMIGGTVRGVVWWGGSDESGELHPAACWPDASGDVSAWLNLVHRGGDLGSDAFIAPLSVADNAGPHYLVVCPLHVGGRVTGLVAIEVVQNDQAHLQSMLELLQWGGIWLELLLKEQGRRQDNGRAWLLKVLAKIYSNADRQAWIDCVAEALSCSRVALVWYKHGRWRLQLLSGRRHIDPRCQRARSLAGDIGATLENMRAQPDTRHIAPLKNKAGELIGGLLLERPSDRPFTQSERLWCEQLAVYAGPLLTLVRGAQPGMLKRGLSVFGAGLHRLLGRGWFKFKLATLGLSMALVLAAMVPVEYRVSAPATLEGRIQRVVTAPRDGYIASAEVRAGDEVKAGDILAVLDSRDLALEAEKWRNQRAQWQKSYRQALADRKPAEARIQHARVAQADAELALIEAQLARNTLRAPIDGIVVSGDLSQLLDAPVSRGDILFEVAPLEAYRVVLQVDDRDVAALQAGQPGELAMDGLPGQYLPFRISRITPMAQVREGRNRFRVEAELSGTAQSLRPGMAGKGKISVGRHSLLWIVGHRTVDWLRLQSWVWWF